MAIWMVARVRGGQELRFKERSERYGAAVYVPLGKHRMVPRRRHSIVIVERPVFRSYAFVEMGVSALGIIREAPQYFGILLDGFGEIFQLDQSLIDRLRERENSGEFDYLANPVKRLAFAIGSELLLKEGPLSGRRGRVIALNSKGNQVILDVSGKIVRMGLSLRDD